MIQPAQPENPHEVALGELMTLIALNTQAEINAFQAAGYDEGAYLAMKVQDLGAIMLSCALKRASARRHGGV